MNSLGERLELVRERADLNKKKFAERLGMTPAGYSNILHGRIANLSESTILLVNLQFGVDKNWIKEGTGEPRFAPSIDLALATDEQKKIFAIMQVLSRKRRSELLSYAEFLAGQEEAEKDLADERVKSG